MTISRHVVPLTASLSFGYRTDPHGSMWRRGRPGRPSSRFIRIRRSRIKNAMPADDDMQPVHFSSFTSRVSSFAAKVYPTKPLLMNTATDMARRSPVVSMTRIMKPRLKSQSKNGLVGVAILMDVRTLIFFAIPILAPPGVSFVQK